MKNRSRKRSELEIRLESIISLRTRKTQINETNNDRLNRMGAKLNFNNKNIDAPM